MSWRPSTGANVVVKPWVVSLSSSAASTCDPLCEQWLAGLGAGAGSLSLGLLAHRWRLVSVVIHNCSLSVIVAPSLHHPYCCSLFHPTSSCSWWQLLSHPCCSSSHYPPCKQWWHRWGLKQVGVSVPSWCSVIVIAELESKKTKENLN
jgi:hypothetical protein